MRISFVVDGPIVPKGRPRFGKGRTYTDKRTETYTVRVATEAKRLYRFLPPMLGEMEMSLTFYFKVPGYFTRQQRADALAGRMRPKVRPDWDNLGKLVSDALNNIVYKDDGQITDVTIRKRYAKEPRLEVEVWEVEYADGKTHPSGDVQARGE